MATSAARHIMAGVVLGIAMSNVIAADAAEKNGMIHLPGGEYRPLISASSTPKVLVRPFLLDAAPVTNRAFAKFVADHPQWSAGKVLPMFAEPRYLQHWDADKTLPQAAPGDEDKPVVNISWFAARAYCTAQGKRLPTIAEWEFAGRASATRPDGSADPDYVQHILGWYAQPATQALPAVMQSRPNYWGIHDMHGVIWEWTQDFNMSEVLRTQQSNLQTLVVNGKDVPVDLGAFCGAGAAGVANPSDYAAFMRYSFRSSLKATFVLDTLGFRCAADEGTQLR